MTVEIHFLDVGQGDCSVLLFKEGDEILRSVVIDCGGSYPYGEGELRDDLRDEQQAGQKLLKFCKKHHVESFDIWIITHWDRDHFGGFNHILREANDVEKIRNMLQELRIYDRGECFNYNFTYCFFTSGDIRNQKTDYVNFRERLSELKQKNEELNLTRSTERVYGNSNFDRRSFTLKPGGFTFISSEPTKGEYLFRAPDYLLEEDLLNRGFDDKLDASLECLAVNGWYRKRKGGNSVSIDFRGVHDGENGRSMGLLLTFNEFSCWFGGDLESAIEDTLIPVIQNRLGNRPLSLSKASHHGSHFSTSDDFINALQPDALIVSSPPESSNHPHPNFLKRVALNDTIEAVYLTGCRPYVGRDQRNDGRGGTVIEGIDTDKLLGLSGELITTSKQRKFYVCGGTEHATNKVYSGDISVTTSGDRKKKVIYWEAFGQPVPSDDNPDDILEDLEPIDLESLVDDYGNLYDGVKVDHDSTYSKYLRLKPTVVRKTKKSKKRKRDDEYLYEIKGLMMTEEFEQPKKRRLDDD